MVDKFTKKWYENKDKLQHYFETNIIDNYDSYEQLVEIVLKYIINNGVENYHELGYNKAIQIDKLIPIDYGDYQGTLIFIFPEHTYQPTVDETYYTFVEYGSCSGCDTLQGILGSYGELPTEGEVKELMILSLHLIQNIHCFKEI